MQRHCGKQLIAEFDINFLEIHMRCPKFVRLLLLLSALFGSGMVGAISFALVYVAPVQYVTIAVIAVPVCGFLSVLLGGGVYGLLSVRKIPVTPSKCVWIGALLGAIPGVVLWATSQSPSAEWSATRELATAAWNPVLFGVFGAIGGLSFAGLSSVLRLR